VPAEFLTMQEAQEYLGVSRTKLWTLVKEGVVATFSDPLDKRRRLVRKDDIAVLKLPQPKS